jgi:hypothetical protein
MLITVTKREPEDWLGYKKLITLAMAVLCHLPPDLEILLDAL